MAPSTATAPRPVPAPEWRLHSAPTQQLRRVERLAAPAPGGLAVLVRACRPRQWLKNLVVVLAPASARALTRGSALAETCGAFLVFCLLASATYLVNDVLDRDSDRRHPRKRLRPVAAGQLSPRRALKAAALLAVVGLGLAFAIRPALGAVAGCYLALTFSYSLVWREVVVADIVIVAMGFLVRAAAGGAATDVRLSKAFLLVTSACALFVVAGKRYAEARERGASTGTRRTLHAYSPGTLRRVLVGAASVATVAYAAWALTRSAAGPWIELSVLPFALWIGRYFALLSTGAGETPEQLILGDAGLLVAGAIWALLFLIGLYGAR